MRPQRVERLPEAAEFVLGISLIRGVPTPILDAATLLGDAPTVSPSRFVIVRAGERHVGIAVDEVIGVHTLSGSALDDAPPLTSEALTGAVAAIGRLDRELLIVLESTRLIPAEVWAALGEVAA